MAELLECLFCGYKTTRCGMINHVKAKHPGKIPHTGYYSTDDFAKPLGIVVHWSKNRKQTPKFLKRFNCIRCGKKLTKEEHEIDTGNLCGDCRKATINEDERQ